MEPRNVVSEGEKYERGNWIVFFGFFGSYYSIPVAHNIDFGMKYDPVESGRSRVRVVDSEFQTETVCI